MKSLTHLQRLEAESIHIMREVVSETRMPVMLFSIGKDSAVMLHLAKKAFYPSVPPFPLLHVDTTWKFNDMYALREKAARDAEMDLLVWENPEAKAQGINPFDHGALHTDMWKTQGLKQALDHYGFDAAFGGARRDEEKSRAKERIFSFRTASHAWDPKNQRPEPWNGFTTPASVSKAESFRVFPISNWTELGRVAVHISRKKISRLCRSISRPRRGRRGGARRRRSSWRTTIERMKLLPWERSPAGSRMRSIRFRTLGCYPLTGAVESNAATHAADVLPEMRGSPPHRNGRAA